MTDRELMQQALDALSPWAGEDANHTEQYASYNALRDRLERKEPGPVAWANREELKNIKNFDANIYANGGFDDAVPLYTTPPRRKPLTDEEIKEAVLDNPAYGAALMSMVSDDVTVVEFRQAINGIARAIETTHGIKP